MTFVTDLPDGGYHIRHGNGEESWYDRDGHYHRDGGPAYIGIVRKRYFHHGLIHRLDGPAIVWNNGKFRYMVMGRVPKTILDIIITDQPFDFTSFPSAELISDYAGDEKAYRINDPEELVLAILRYG